MPPELVSEIGPALAGVTVAIRSVIESSDDIVDALLIEIGAFIKLVGGGWPPEHRQEFIEQAATDFADVPASLIAPVLREARRRVRWAREFVPWVHEAVEQDWSKLKVEQNRLRKLAEIAAAS